MGDGLPGQDVAYCLQVRITANISQQPVKSDRVLSLAREVSFVRPRDVEGIGVPREYLLRLHRTGQLERVGRGLYRLPDASVTEHHQFAQVARRVDRAVICLLSALTFHDIGTQNPFEIWIAIPRGTRPPKLESPRLRVTTLSGKAFEEGIEEHVIEGVTVRIYGVAKTVVDCFRFRNKIGLDVALEALRESVLSKKATINEINRYAKLSGLQRVMRPYLESL